jgi:hypothetical protein
MALAGNGTTPRLCILSARTVSELFVTVGFLKRSGLYTPELACIAWDRWEELTGLDRYHSASGPDRARLAEPVDDERPAEAAEGLPGLPEQAARDDERLKVLIELHRAAGGFEDIGAFRLELVRLVGEQCVKRAPGGAP